MPKAKTQAEQRRDIVCTDQFGRTWLVAIELATGDPCAIDAAGWTDPLRNSSKYVVMPRNTYGTQQWGQVMVDYDRWIRETEEYEKNWRMRFIEVGREMNKGTFDPEKWAESPYLTELVGPKPFPSTQVLRMAKAGHREFLGLQPLSKAGRKLLGQQTVEELEAEVFAAPVITEDAPVWADAPETYTEFVKWAIGTKQAANIKEAAALWNAAKAGR